MGEFFYYLNTIAYTKNCVSKTTSFVKKRLTEGPHLPVNLDVIVGDITNFMQRCKHANVVEMAQDHAMCPHPMDGTSLQNQDAHWLNIVRMQDFDMWQVGHMDDEVALQSRFM